MTHTDHPTRLTVGTRAVVGCGRPDANRIRPQPSTTSTPLDSAPVGSLLQILPNPQPGNPYPVEDSAHGLRWWYVRTETDLAGWTTETGPKSNHDTSVVYYLDPVEKPSACLGALPSRLEMGKLARTTATPTLTLRSDAGTNNTAIIAALVPGTEVRLVCHKCVAAMVWWFVVVRSGPHQGKMGWVSEGLNKPGDPDHGYYLEAAR